jgi:hypothetical protein
LYIHMAVWLGGCGCIALGLRLLTRRGRLRKGLGGAALAVGAFLIFGEVYLPFVAARTASYQQLNGQGFWPVGTMSYDAAQDHVLAVAAVGGIALGLGTCWLLAAYKPPGPTLSLMALADAAAAIVVLQSIAPLIEQVPRATILQQPRAWYLGPGTRWDAGSVIDLAQTLEGGAQILLLGGVVAAVLAIWALGGRLRPPFLTRRLLGMNIVAFGVLTVGFAFFLRILCVDAVFSGGP